MMKPVVAAVLLAVCTTCVAQAECRGEIVRLHLAKDGTVSWNSDIIRDSKKLVERFQREARAAEQPKILFQPERDVDPALGLSILDLAQKAGLECVAFSGFEAKRSH
jgi:biopolymer transport protein ExbD